MHETAAALMTTRRIALADRENFLVSVGNKSKQ